VIARVRTYGSVPFLLRGLLVDGDAALPEPGADLVTADGATIGQIASRAWSPVRERTVALAWLDRAHRTPGLSLSFAGGWTATVALLPIYAAPDTASRARQLYDLAVRSYADGDTDLALSRLEAALRVDPSLADAYEAIGVILGKAGKFHDAIDFFRRLEEVVPDEPMVNTNLSLYYMKIGDKETAEDEGGKATLKGMARLRGRTSTDVDQELEQSKVKDAQRKAGMFRRVLTIDDVDGVALFGLGTALLTLGQHEEAAAHLRKAVEVDPKNSPVWLALGKALERCDQVDAAVETYRKGVEVAARKGDLMPLKEMEHRLLLLGRR
jgi:Flp pilus assembly protein TadD